MQILYPLIAAIATGGVAMLVSGNVLLPSEPGSARGAGVWRVQKLKAPGA